VEATWVGHIAAAAAGNAAAGAPAGSRPTVLIYPDQQLEPFRYMFEKLADKAAGARSALAMQRAGRGKGLTVSTRPGLASPLAVLDERIDVMAEEIQKAHTLGDLTHPGLPGQVRVGPDPAGWMRWSPCLTVPCVRRCLARVRKR